MRIKISIFLLIFVCLSALAKGQTPLPPGVVVDHISQETDKYIGSPGLCILPNGDYLASHDEFGPKSTENSSAQTYIFLSKDRGKSWKRIAQIDGQFWSNLFVHEGKAYIMGTNKGHGNLIIRRSDDGGYTWTIPYKPENGLILEGEYHTAPVPMVIHRGRIWRAIEYATAPTTAWGKRYSPMMISAPVHSDLLNAKNWRKTNYLPYDSTYLDGDFGAWIEGNAVVDPDGNVVDILRVNGSRFTQEHAAIVKISRNGKKATFDPRTGFIDLPGGGKKFTIRYDEKSKRYWMLSNYVKPELQYDIKRAFGIRNTQALCSSPDLRNWTVHKIVLDHPERWHHAFQYVEWQFDGDDIIFLSRTAYDDDTGGAHSSHDANFLTFHRIRNFRDFMQDSIRHP